MRRLTTLVATICLSGGLLSCAEQGPTEVAAGAVGTPITLSPMILVAGETTTVAALLPDAEDAVDGVTRLQWHTSEPTVVALVNDTLLAAGAEGSAEVSAASSLSRNSTYIKVMPDYGGRVASISVSLRAFSLQVGDTTRAEAILRDARGNRLSGYAVIWFSTNPAVATVTQSGRVGARAAGVAQIVAWRRGMSGSAALAVGTPAQTPAPTPVASVSVALNASTLSVGQTTQASAVARDSASAVLAGRSVTWTSSNAAVATVSASGMVTAVGGGSAGVTATIEGKAGSATLQVAVVATTLAVVKQPAGAVSGVPLTTQPVVQLRDAAGALVSGATTAVTASLAAGSGKLVGTVTVAAVNGAATFTNLRVDGVGAHTLVFSAAGLTSANATSLVVTQTPAALAIQTQPAGAKTGSALATQPAVRILDNAGLLIASSALVVSTTVASGSATLTGSPAVAVSGVASFANLRLDGTGSVTLRFQTAAPALAVVTGSIPVAVGVPAKLTLTVQPGSATTSGVALAPQPVLQLRDVANNAVPAAGVVVTAAIAAGGGTLGGTATATTSTSGVATFTNLAISGVDGARTLSFSAPSLTAVQSSAVTLTTPTTPSPVGTGSCPNEPTTYTRINEQTWDQVPVHPLMSLGWIDDYWTAASRIPVVSDATSPVASSNHNVAAGTFKQGDKGGSSPFFVYRPFIPTEHFKNIYICLYLKHSADFDNTNGNTGTKFLWPAADQIQGTQTYNGHDGANMDFQFFQQGAVDRRLGANVNVSAARMYGKRGKWVRYEMLLKASSSNSTANGGLDVWIDGVQTHHYTNVQWQMSGARTWLSLGWNPTYGGGFNPVPHDQYQYMDNIRISGSNQ